MIRPLINRYIKSLIEEQNLAKKKTKYPRSCKEFAELVPAKTPAELQNLKDLAERDGEIKQPLFVWKEKNILLLGYEELQLAKATNLSFKIVEVSAKDKESAKAWIADKCFSNTNLTAYQKITLALELEDYYKDQLKKCRLGLQTQRKKAPKVDTLKYIGDKVGYHRTWVARVKYINENIKTHTAKEGTPIKYKRDLMRVRQSLEEQKTGIRNASLRVQDIVRRIRRKKNAHSLRKFVNPPKGTYISQIINGDCVQVMKDMASHGLAEQISLITFSPKYNNRTNYGSICNDDLPHDEYLKWLGTVITAAAVLLKRGGKLIINIDSMTNVRKKEQGQPYKFPILFDLYNLVNELAIDLHYMQDICWHKTNGPAGKKTAWGSYCKPSAPNLTRDHEYLIVWAKGEWKLKNETGLESDLTAAEWKEWIKSTWHIAAASSRAKDGEEHPCRWPERLVHRITKMFTWPGDICLDPFNGTGNSTVVFKQLGRRYIGIDLNDNYCEAAKRRTEEATFEL